MYSDKNFRGKTPSEDIEEMAKSLGLPGNVTLDPNWFQRSMLMDPLKWYFLVSYGVLIIVTLQILTYSNWDKLIVIKQKLGGIIKAGPVLPPAADNDNTMSTKYANDERKDEGKFWERKTKIIGTGQSLILIGIGFTFLVPMAVVRRMSREHIEAINNGIGRFWIYVSKISIPLSYQLLFPLFIIAGNANMRASLIRGIRESELAGQLTHLSNQVKVLLRLKTSPT